MDETHSLSCLIAGDPTVEIESLTVGWQQVQADGGRGADTCARVIQVVLVIHKNDIRPLNKKNSGIPNRVKVVNLMDGSGRVVLSETFYDNKYRMNLQDLPSGMYILKVTNNDKLIVQKVIRR